MKQSPAARYNYKREGLYAGIMAAAFMASVGFGLPAHVMPVPIVHPKEVKKKVKQDEDEDSMVGLTDSCEIALFQLAMPSLTAFERATYSASQARMIIKDFMNTLREDTAQVNIVMQ